MSLSRLNPTTSLISFYPLHPLVPTPGFSFNEMFGSLLFIFSVLSFHFLPTYLLPFPPSLSLGFYQSSCSKVIKGQHIEGALLGCVIFYSHALLFVFYFCLWWQTLSGRWARDKPSVVLCGEIIRQADKACWVSSSLLIRSSRHCLFLFPR